jgi:hypothetical protein
MVDKNKFVFRNVLIPFTGLLLFFVLQGFGQEDYGTWGHHKTIVINTSSTGYGISQTLTGFPYIVKLDDTDSAFTLSLSASDGGDIRFARGAAHLSYQVEKWDAVNKIAAIWVKVDTIRSNDSTQAITMYFGKSGVTSQSNASAVFPTSGRFAAVYHFAAPDTFNDATANAANGTNYGSVLDQGAVGDGRSFSGTYIQYGNPGCFQIGDSITVSAWIKTTTQATAYTSVIRHDGQFTALQMDNGGSAGLVAFDTGGTYHLYFAPWSTGGWTNGGWHYYTAQYSSTSGARIYKDGSLYYSDPTTYGRMKTTTTAGLIIGNSENADEPFTGSLDEVEIANTLRNDSWIKLCYLTQHVIPTAPPVINYPNKHIFIPINSFADSIKPVITGVVDSLSISPFPLPGDLMFDNQTGVITGNAVELAGGAPFVITAYNAKGSNTDTIYITIGDPSGVNMSRKNAFGNGQPRLMGLFGRQQPRILYFAPSAGFTDFMFTIYNVAGTKVWTSGSVSAVSGGGVQSVPAGNWTLSRGKNITQGMYFIEMKALNGISGRTIVQRSKPMFVQP